VTNTVVTNSVVIPRRWQSAWIRQSGYCNYGPIRNIFGHSSFWFLASQTYLMPCQDSTRPGISSTTMRLSWMDSTGTESTLGRLCAGLPMVEATHVAARACQLSNAVSYIFSLHSSGVPNACW
jgi:hypothetical protein